MTWLAWVRFEPGVQQVPRRIRGADQRSTQQVLARQLGTTREVVARLIQEFVGAGLLRTGRGRLYIADLFGLRRVVTER